MCLVDMEQAAVDSTGLTLLREGSLHIFSGWKSDPELVPMPTNRDDGSSSKEPGAGFLIPVSPSDKLSSHTTP